MHHMGAWAHYEPVFGYTACGTLTVLNVPLTCASPINTINYYISSVSRYGTWKSTCAQHARTVQYIDMRCALDERALAFLSLRTRTRVLKYIINGLPDIIHSARAAIWDANV